MLAYQGLLRIPLWASFAYLASSSCNRTLGRVVALVDYEYVWDEEHVELNLCCNETTLKASWIAGDDVRFITKLEYSCTNNQSGLLIGKNTFSSGVRYAIIKSADSCSAKLTYSDYEMPYSISTTCTIDLCLSNPCQTHERCSSSDGTFTCSCGENFDSNCTYCEKGFQFSGNKSECICGDGDLRLVGTAAEGQVEVCMNNKFGAICDVSWGIEEAQVVCQQLGFNNESVAFFSNTKAPSSLVHVNGIQCIGNETSLLTCSWNKSKTCSGRRGVGVRCGVVQEVTSTLEIFAQSTTKVGAHYVAVGMVISASIIGFTAILILLLIHHRRTHDHRKQKWQVDKYFSQALDVNFEPNFTYSISDSISLQSMATTICPMEKESSRMGITCEELKTSHYHSIMKMSDPECVSECGSQETSENSPESNGK